MATVSAVVLWWPATSNAQSGTSTASPQGLSQLKGPGLSEEHTRSVRYAFNGQGQQRDEAAVRKAIERAKRGSGGKSNATTASAPEKGMELARCYEEMMGFAGASVRALDTPLETARRGGQKQRLKALQKQRDSREQKVLSWRGEAIKQLAVVARDHRDYSRRDEALYRLAYIVEEQANDDRRRTRSQNQPVPSASEKALRQQARRVYRELIKNYPNSRFIPHAYLSFGEYYYNEGEMENALAFYQRVAQYSSSEVYGYSIYKIAWCHQNLQDSREAVSQFVQVIQHGSSNPQARLSGDLTRLAKREIVAPFSQAFPPSRAWTFFKRVGGNEAVWMMEALAEQYVLRNRWTEAAGTYRSLIVENQGSVRVSFYRTRLTECEGHIQP